MKKIINYFLLCLSVLSIAGLLSSCGDPTACTDECTKRCVKTANRAWKRPARVCRENCLAGCKKTVMLGRGTYEFSLR